MGNYIRSATFVAIFAIDAAAIGFALTLFVR
jgi:hypothetical protein